MTEAPRTELRQFGIHVSLIEPEFVKSNIVSHLLQITAARHVLFRDQASADEALDDAERLGRQSLADIRGTIGLLNSERQPTGPQAPLPNLADLPALIEHFRHAGLSVDLRVDGAAGQIAPASRLGLYRIAQEALANAAKHAPGARVHVELVVDDGSARLRIADTGAADAARPGPAAGGSGLGLQGMRERASAMGGSLRAGPVEGGWLIECTAPVGV